LYEVEINQNELSIAELNKKLSDYDELKSQLCEKDEMIQVLNKQKYNLEFLLDISKSDLKQAVADMKSEN
jgi:hypothetical protein